MNANLVAISSIICNFAFVVAMNSFVGQLLGAGIMAGNRQGKLALRLLLSAMTSAAVMILCSSIFAAAKEGIIGLVLNIVCLFLVSGVGLYSLLLPVEIAKQNGWKDLGSVKAVTVIGACASFLWLLALASSFQKKTDYTKHADGIITDPVFYHPALDKARTAIDANVRELILSLKHAGAEDEVRLLHSALDLSKSGKDQIPKIKKCVQELLLAEGWPDSIGDEMRSLLVKIDEFESAVPEE